MPAVTPPEAELTKLNQEIERLEAEQVLLEEQRKKREAAVRSLTWRSRYLQLATLIRQPASKWDWWPLALVLIGPALFGVASFVLINLVTGWGWLALFGFFIAAVAGVAWVGSLLYRPATAFLPSAMESAEAERRVATAHWKEAFDRLDEVKTQLTRLVDDRRQRMASGRVQRAALLQRPWRRMAGVEWEDFVVEVCRTLGAAVERRGRGDAGAELAIDFGQGKVATLVQTSRDPIDSAQVQQAILFKEREQTDACAIITNGRFTGAAQDYATRLGCKLVGRDEFPEFALGNLRF
jgi:hypothetical protein